MSRPVTPISSSPHARRRPVAGGLLAALLALTAGEPGAPVHAATNELPSLGASSGETLSRDEERQLGQAVMEQVRAQLDLVHDPELNGYLRSLGERIASASGQPDQPFEFFLVRDPTINAFALPGGYIGVHTGLIEAARNESELAAVLAHEAAHVTQRHIARSFEKAGQTNLATLAAVVAAVLLGSQDPELGQAALSAGVAAGAQAQINFTRANEEEADRVGIQTLARADFDPSAMAGFFERLQQQNRYYGNRLPEFLSTHPVTTSRIADARSRAKDYEGGEAEDRLAFYLMQAKLEVSHAETPQAAVQHFRDALERDEPATPEAARRYGYALALLADGDLDAAREQLDTLSSRHGDRLAYQIAIARVETEAGNIERALDVYRDAYELYPSDVALASHYAEGLLAADQPEEARSLLARYVRRHTGEVTTYQLLARAAGEAGRPAESHEALAEYYYRNGQLRAAIEQLELAREALDEEAFHRASGIDARLRELKRQAELKSDVSSR